MHVYARVVCVTYLRGKVCIYLIFLIKVNQINRKHLHPISGCQKYRRKKPQCLKICNTTNKFNTGKYFAFLSEVLSIANNKAGKK